ncbi:MAG: FAD-dependent oxidoreductase, partial [Chitinispirillaceae bacterium]|nr:FAD-dependent oxidoreductase [Chitinispirillaceae bacterium]
MKTQCLIIGGGPAGLSAALELAESGIRSLLVDDKHVLGGKLTLQTHTFFGSVENCFAGTRGIDIALLLGDRLKKYRNLVDIWLDSPAIGVFYDGKVGVARQGRYVLVEPETLLVAAGLSPIDEMYKKAVEYGMKAFIAGDAEEIAEASAAIFSGRIHGRKIVRELNGPIAIPEEWERLHRVLKGKPGRIRYPNVRSIAGKIYPRLWCVQEIPCNPCIVVCPKKAIEKETGAITGVPFFKGDACSGCNRCVLACPGLAIVLVDETYDSGSKKALLRIPFELLEGRVNEGDEVITVDGEGKRTGSGIVVKVKNARSQDRRLLLYVEVPFEDHMNVAGLRIQEPEPGETRETRIVDETTIICRCERVTRGEIVRLIRAGCRDMNQLKA